MLVISIYEAIAPVVQQKPLVKPVSGAIVPQQDNMTQQAQQSQVPAQPAAQIANQTAIQQPIQATTQSSPVQQNSSKEELTQGNIPNDQQQEPTWKRNLKIAALVGAGLGVGGLLHFGHENNWWGIKDKLLPGASLSIPDDSETGTAEETTSKDIKNNQTDNERPVKTTSAARDILSPAKNIEPKGPPQQEHQWGAVRIGNGGVYNTKHPMNINPLGVGESSRSIYWNRYHSVNPNVEYGEWADNIPSYGSPGTSLNQGIIVRPKHHPNVATRYDFGMREYDTNGN